MFRIVVLAATVLNHPKVAASEYRQHAACFLCLGARRPAQVCGKREGLRKKTLTLCAIKPLLDEIRTSDITADIGLAQYSPGPLKVMAG
jgi:hypothetical protein